MTTIDPIIARSDDRIATLRERMQEAGQLAMDARSKGDTASAEAFEKESFFIECELRINMGIRSDRIEALRSKEREAEMARRIARQAEEDALFAEMDALFD